MSTKLNKEQAQSSLARAAQQAKVHKSVAAYLEPLMLHHDPNSDEHAVAFNYGIGGGHLHTPQGSGGGHG